MTTEAEEFKKENQRFKELRDQFLKIWLRHPDEYFDYEYKHSHYGYSYMIDFYSKSLLENDEFNQRQSFALRALNDRLEKALKGEIV